MQKKAICRILGAKPSLADPPQTILLPCYVKKLQNFGSQALLVRTCYGHPKNTANYWEPSPACQILPILFSCHVPPPPPTKSYCNILGAQPSLAEYKKQDTEREEDIDQKNQTFFGKLEALLREN